MTFTFKLARRLAGFPVIAAALFLFQSSCQTPEAIAGFSPPDTVVARVIVTPQYDTTGTSQTVRLTAVALNAAGDPIPAPLEWSATGGSIDTTGRFLASVAGVYRVKVRHRTQTQLSDSSVVVVNPPTAQLTALAMTPTSAALLTGQSRQFAVTGTWSDGSHTAPAVSYSATGGSINASGFFVAGSAAGSFQVIATAQAANLADTSTVTISLPAVTLTSLTLNPGSAALQSGASRQFSVTGSWSDGSTTTPTVTYTATGGTINASGLYSAGATAGTFRVIATQQGGGLADSSTVTITVPVATLTSLTVSPSSASVETGSTRQFTAGGTWSDGSTTAPAVTYSATGGTISSGGLFTAGSSAGSFRVIAIQQGGSLADTAQVTVTLPTLSSLTLTPSNASILTGATQQYSVAALWSDGGSSVPAVTYSATGGTVTSGGLYTAGSTAGTYRVIVSSQGKADTSSVTVSAAAPVLQGIVMTPNTLSIVSGDHFQFSVAGVWSNGATTAPAVDFVATGGAVLADGTYWSGTSAGTFRVVATVQGGTLADTSVITITMPAPVLTGLTLTPASTSVQTGTTRQFSVAATWSDGGTTVPAVSYSATGGTISSGGLYTAGGTAGGFRVIVSGSGKADTAAVTVTSSAPPTIASLTVSPGSASVRSGSTQQFTVSATMSDGSTQSAPSVTWTATGGTISTGGVFTAGSTVGGFSVTATSSNGKSDNAAVTVTAAGSGGPGNLYSMSFENGNFGSLSNGGGAAPNNYSIMASGGFSGAHYAQAALAASSGDNGANMFWDGGAAHNDLWVVVAIKVTVPPSTGIAIQKMVTFRQAGYNAQLGQMVEKDGSYVWNWLESGADVVISGAGSLNSTVGQWNVWKFHLDGRGAKPVLTIGLNGVDNILTTTKSGAKIADPAMINFGGTLNGGSGPSTFGFDYMQIGTSDPGWP